jgi:hypothetical protein
MTDMKKCVICWDAKAGGSPPYCKKCFVIIAVYEAQKTHPFVHIEGDKIIGLRLKTPKDT